MPSRQLCFLVTSNVSKSKKRHELDRARALSHTVTVVHDRRWARQDDRYGQKQARHDGEDDQNDRLFSAVDEESCAHALFIMDLLKPRLALCDPMYSPSTDAWYLQENLDPFLQLPGPISQHERKLLQHCKFSTSVQHCRRLKCFRSAQGSF